jgi:hypothetical protein
MLLGLAALALLVRQKDRVALVAGDDREQQARHTAEMDNRLQGLRRRLDRKVRVMQALLARRLKLLEAAALFRFLDHEPPEFPWKQFRERYPDGSEEERHCHEVITFARMTLINEDKADEVCEQLLAEVCKELERGPLRLPDVARISWSFDEPVVGED